MRRTTTTTTTAVLLTLVLGLAACDSIAENVTERVVEEALEAGAGSEDVEVDLDTDGEGGVSVTSDDGEFNVSAGGGEIPDDWPDEIVFPDGIQLNVTNSSGSEDMDSYTYNGTVPDTTLDDVLGPIDEAITSMGYTLANTTDSTSNGQAATFRTYESGENRIVVQASDNQDGGVAMTYSAQFVTG